MNYIHTRVQGLDIARGAGILLVVIGHTNTPPLVHSFIYSFHVPLFFILSGYTIRRSLNLDFQSFIKQKAQTLLWPYLIFSVLAAIAFGFASKDPTYRVILSDIHLALKLQDNIDTPLWFLLGLFSASLWYWILSAGSKMLAGVFALALSVSALIILHFFPIDLPLRFLSSAQYVIFIHLGHFLATRRPDSHPISLPKQAARAALSLGFLCSLVYIGKFLNWELAALSFLCSSIVGATMITNFSTICVGVPFLSTGLRWCGKNSLSIMCVHEVVMKVFRQVVTPFVGRGVDQFLMVIVIFGLVWGIAKYAPALLKFPFWNRQKASGLS